MRANAFERGQRAKRKGRLLEANPFAKRVGKANEKRASDWALGWHSTEALGVSQEARGAWTGWLPMSKPPSPPEGDYGVRERGLRALLRPTDPIEYEVLVEEMKLGVVDWVPQWARVGYTILWFYAESVNGELGAEPDWDVHDGHPMLYLYSCLKLQAGECSRWPTLVVSAYEELA